MTISAMPGEMVGKVTESNTSAEHCTHGADNLASMLVVLTRKVSMSANSTSPSPQRRLPTWVAVLGALAAIAVIVAVLVQLGVLNQNKAATPTPHTTSPTTTLTATPLASQTYSAPAPACGDTGGGLWEASSTGVTTIQCTSTGMTLIDTQPSNTDKRAEAFFSWPKHPFGARYSMQADVSAFGASSCAGMTTHRDGDPAARQHGYYFKLCNDAALSVSLGRINDTGAVTELFAGSLKDFGITQAPQYRLRVVVDGANQTFLVNGVSIKAVQDTTYASTSKISLLVDGASAAGAQSTATFSNFTLVISPA